MAELSTVARPYAKAAFEYALAKKALAEWSEMLSFAAAVAQAEEMMTVLGSPSLTAKQQAEAFIGVCGDKVNQQGQHFVSVLAENKRLKLLPAIAQLFELLKANQEKTVDINVTTAFELVGEQEEKLAKSLASRLERDVNVECEVDKGLLGGVVIRAGDLFIDGSVRGRLAKLAEAMNS